MEKKKCTENKLFDFSKFEEWFALTYIPVNCGGLKVPKVISFKEHIRILKEKDNDYNKLLNDYNKLVDDFNSLRKVHFEATGELYRRKEEDEK
jgi:hypothetical protein